MTAMIYGKHRGKIKTLWTVISVIVVLGMILLYIEPLLR